MVTKVGVRATSVIVSMIIMIYPVTVDSATWQEIWEGDVNESFYRVAAKSDSEAVFFDGDNAYAYDGSGFIPIAGFPAGNSGGYDSNGNLWIGSWNGIYKCQDPPFGSYILEVPTIETVKISISNSGGFGLAVADGSEGYVFDGSVWTYINPGFDDLLYTHDVSTFGDGFGAFCGHWDSGYYMGVYNYGIFDEIDSPISFDRCSVAGEGDVWFSDYDSFFHYSNGSWTDYSYVCDVPGEDDGFVDVDFLSSDDGWVKKSWSVLYGQEFENYSKMFHYNGSGWVPYPPGDGYIECGGTSDVKIVDSTCGYTCGVYWEDAMTYIYKAYKFHSGVSITPTSVGRIKAMFR